MSDLLRTGATFLEAQRAAHMASTVTFRRGDTEAAANATWGRTDYEVEDEFGLIIVAQVTDFLIGATAYPLTGEPELGDQIAAGGVTYEVMSLGGQGHWRWSDPHRTTLRIHTKQIATE